MSRMKQALRKLQEQIDSETRSLSHREYREVMEELQVDIEARLDAHRAEHPEL